MPAEGDLDGVWSLPPSLPPQNLLLERIRERRDQIQQQQESAIMRQMGLEAQVPDVVTMRMVAKNAESGLPSSRVLMVTPVSNASQIMHV